MARVVIGLISLLSLSGCDLGLVTTCALRPWFANQTKVFDPRLLGTWETGNHSERYVILREARSTYYIRYWSDGEETPFHVVLGKIGDRYYLDQRSNAKIDDSYYWGRSDDDFSDCLQLLSTTHSINRIECGADKMIIRTLNAERLNDFLSSPDSTRQKLESIQVPCDGGEAEILLLVSETSELEEFLARYGDVDSLWENVAELHRIGP